MTDPNLFHSFISPCSNKGTKRAEISQKESSCTNKIAKSVTSNMHLGKGKMPRPRKKKSKRFMQFGSEDDVSQDLDQFLFVCEGAKIKKIVNKPRHNFFRDYYQLVMSSEKSCRELLRNPQLDLHTTSDVNTLKYVIVPRTENVSSEEEFSCLICQSEPVLPKITKCGHIYCHSCIVTCCLENTRNQNAVECPSCFKIVHRKQLYSVIWSKVTEPSEGQNIECVLSCISRKGSSGVISVEKLLSGFTSGLQGKDKAGNCFPSLTDVMLKQSVPVSSGSYFLCHDIPEYSFNPVMYLPDSFVVERYFLESAVTTLNDQLSSICDHVGSDHITRAIKTILGEYVADLRRLKKSKTVRNWDRKQRGAEVADWDFVESNEFISSDYCYFYQVRGMKNVYLHPVFIDKIYSILSQQSELLFSDKATEFNLHDMPLTLTGTIGRVDTVTVSPTASSVYEFLSQHPINSTIRFVGLNLTEPESLAHVFAAIKLDEITESIEDIKSTAESVSEWISPREDSYDEMHDLMEELSIHDDTNSIDKFSYHHSLLEESTYTENEFFLISDTGEFLDTDENFPPLCSAKK